MPSYPPPACRQSFNTNGELAWALIGIPCLEYRAEKTAIGVPNPACATFFGFHKATQIVQSVHHVEHSHHIYKRDRQFRMAVTVADQAIQGPGSVQFSREECRVDQTAEDPIAIGICRFASRTEWVSQLTTCSEKHLCLINSYGWFAVILLGAPAI